MAGSSLWRARSTRAAGSGFWRGLLAARSWTTGFAYRGDTSRDLRLDLLRGFAVFAMVVDHLGGDSPLYLLTGGNRFYVSAAEAFVFLSGLLVGLAYGRIAATQGLGTALWRLLERAWTLYVLAVGLTLLVLPASELLALPWATGIDLHNSPALVWSILTLHQTYHLVDVPLLCALLLLAAPLAFVLLSTGRTAILLTISWAIWAGYQALPDDTQLPWPIQGNELFQFPAWQVLFFTAMAIGYHHDRVRRLIARWEGRLLVLSSAALVGLVVAFVVTMPVLDAIRVSRDGSTLDSAARLLNLQETLFAKPEVRPGRLVAAAVVFTFGYLAVSRYWVPLRRAIGWFLLPLGQNALYAYSAHIVIAVLLASAAPDLRWSDESALVNGAVQVASLGLIWLAIRYRLFYPTPESRRRWMASVIPIAATLLVVLELVPSPELARAASEPVSLTQADRLARAFGTPIPRSTMSVAVATPAPRATPVPTVRPASGPSTPAVRVIPHVGAIDGMLRERRFFSTALDRAMSYYVYLPPGYATDGRRYPVLYMLHGAGGSKDEWLAYGLVDALDRLIAAHDVQPMILVLPQGDTGYWVNQPNGGPAWGDYVAVDLVRQIDATFRSEESAGERAIGGLSMGGAGALQLAFNHPDVFGVVGAHSPSLHLDDGTFPQYGTGTDFTRREPLNLAATRPGLQTLRIWIDAGEQDPWLDRDRVLDTILSERGIAHELRVLPGGHEGPYWQRNTPSYLRFYDSAF